MYILKKIIVGPDDRLFERLLPRDIIFALTLTTSSFEWRSPSTSLIFIKCLHGKFGRTGPCITDNYQLRVLINTSTIIRS